MSRIRFTKNEVMAIALTALLIGFMGFELNKVFQAGFPHVLPPIVMFAFIGLLAKTFFYATSERDLIPQDAKLWVLFIFILVMIGGFIGCLGSVLRNHVVGIALMSLGIALALLSFLTLQRIATKAPQDKPSESAGHR